MKTQDAVIYWRLTSDIFLIAPQNHLKMQKTMTDCKAAFSSANGYRCFKFKHFDMRLVICVPRLNTRDLRLLSASCALIAASRAFIARPASDYLRLASLYLCLAPWCSVCTLPASCALLPASCIHLPASCATILSSVAHLGG
jgi:hypothetical protein